MPPRTLVRAFVIQWWTAGLLLLFWSVRTAVGAIAIEAGHHHNPHLALLGLVEAAAALLFLIPRSLRIGATALLLTFAVAFAAHALRQEFRADLLLYAAVVFFVAVHGAVPISWLRSIPENK